jgi:hypothetical protein
MPRFRRFLRWGIALIVVSLVAAPQQLNRVQGALAETTVTLLQPRTALQM